MVGNIEFLLCVVLFIYYVFVFVLFLKLFNIWGSYIFNTVKKINLKIYKKNKVKKVRLVWNKYERKWILWNRMYILEVNYKLDFEVEEVKKLLLVIEI